MPRFLIKILLFGLIIFISQSIIYRVSEQNSDPELLDQVGKFHKAIDSRVDIIYFGDSVLTSINLDDPDKTNLSNILTRDLPEYKIATIYHDAYNPQMFAAYMKALEPVKQKPKYTIIPINLRSFAPQWNQRPDYQFKKEKWLLSLKGNWLVGVALRPLMVFKVTNPEIISQLGDPANISIDQYENTPVYHGNIRIGKVKDFPVTSMKTAPDNVLKRALEFYYLGSIRQDNTELAALLEIARESRKQSVRPIFYITPIDFRTVERFWGQDGLDQIQSNVILITDALAKEGVNTIDMSMSLSSKDFDWEKNTYPNEHLKYNGRVFVGQKIKEIITNLNK